MENLKQNSLINLVTDSLIKAERGESKLNQDILAIDGMSSPKFRHFLNNVCSQPNTKYLEIGCWKGSTLVSALFGNTPQAIVIDNWSEYNGSIEALLANVNKHVPNSNLLMVENDCFKVNLKDFPKDINVYFYDGNHSVESQTAAFTYFNDVLDDAFIAIVDDWNDKPVQNGTYAAFKKLNYTVLFEKSLFTRGNGDIGSWWNGIYVAVIKKP